MPPPPKKYRDNLGVFRASVCKQGTFLQHFAPLPWCRNYKRNGKLKWKPDKNAEYYLELTGISFKRYNFAYSHSTVETTESNHQ